LAFPLEVLSKDEYDRGITHARGAWLPWRRRIWKALIEDIWTDAEATDFFGRTFKTCTDDQTRYEIANKIGEKCMRLPACARWFEAYVGDLRTPELDAARAIFTLDDTEESETSPVIRRAAVSLRPAIREAALTRWLSRAFNDAKRAAEKAPRVGRPPTDPALRHAFGLYLAEVPRPLSKLEMLCLHGLGLLSEFGPDILARRGEAVAPSDLVLTASDLEFIYDAMAQAPDTVTRLVAHVEDEKSSAEMRAMALGLLALNHAERGETGTLLEARLICPAAQDRLQALQWLLLCYADNPERRQAAILAIQNETDPVVLRRMVDLVFDKKLIVSPRVASPAWRAVRSSLNDRLARLASNVAFWRALADQLRRQTNGPVRDEFANYLLGDIARRREHANKMLAAPPEQVQRRERPEGLSALIAKTEPVQPTRAEIEKWISTWCSIEAELVAAAAMQAPLATPDQVIPEDIDRVVAILLGRDTNKAEQEAVGKFASDRPDRDAIGLRLEHMLETGSVKRFQGYSNEYFPEEYARGERAQAWHWLLHGYFDKNQAIQFVLRQIESAHRTAGNPSEQEDLEEAALEAIAEISRYYKGDCDVAAALASVTAFPYILWRLHGDWLYRFVGCPAIVPPLARRLSGEYKPEAVPPGGRAEPSEFPISTAKLFKGIAPHLAHYPEQWDLLERSVVAHAGEFGREDVKAFVDVLRGDPRTPALLRAMCARMPTRPEDANRNAQVLRLYMAHYHHLEVDSALLRRIATEGQDLLAQEAMHWLARFYQDDAGTAELLIDRMRAAAGSKVRVCAFHCLMLYFSSHRPIAELLIAQPKNEPNHAAAEQMENALGGKQTYGLYSSFEALEENPSRREGELFRRQVEGIRHFRNR
jgi:hypothetical protein